MFNSNDFRYGHCSCEVTVKFLSKGYGSSSVFGILISLPYLVGCMIEAGATTSGGTALHLSRARSGVVWGREGQHSA